MNRETRSLLTLPVAMLLVACGGQDAGDTLTAADKPLPEGRPSAAETPGSPGTVFEFSYEIVGTPIVGSPVSIDLQIQSAFGDEAIEVGYQIPDSTALAMDAAQPRTLTRTPLAGERSIRERVTVIPQREGRLYINVSAVRASNTGSMSSVISIPIHVGNVDTSIREHGELQTNEEGETTRVLTSD